MTYRAHILPGAERDFQSQFGYIAKHSPRGAAKWANALYDALKSLESHPHRGFAPENDRLESEIRQFHFKSPRGLRYRILFTIRGDEVFILHIRGPGQETMQAEDFELPD